MLSQCVVSASKKSACVAKIQFAMPLLLCCVSTSFAISIPMSNDDTLLTGYVFNIVILLLPTYHLDMIKSKACSIQISKKW